MNEILTYVTFIINFLIMFAIFITVILLIAGIFKTKDYSMELVFLGLVSFCIFMALTEFVELTIISYKVAEAMPPTIDTLISDMFILMASMLIFGIAVMKNKLEKMHLGSKK